MDRFMAYLRIPSVYASGLRRLRWSATGDVLEFDEGNTFAFAAEVFPFLEGFVSQRPLIHFAHIVHLLFLLKYPGTPFLGRSDSMLSSAFHTTQRPYRNAGVFCAILCKDIPDVPDPPLTLSTGTFQLEVGASEPLFTEVEGEMPPVVFEARILRALSSYSFEEILHWLRHGRGPVSQAGENIAQAVLLDEPHSLHGVLADLAQRQRLSGAVPFVEQLVSALTLPPRRLEQSELPMGGYSDVATHGQVEQLLPSQLVFDDLEFVRRHAERELLYFRREDPHLHTREDLVVLLDQGMRTWGTVRLVLTAALFALGRLAERRKLPFLVSATSAGGELVDPLQASAAVLHELMEASDLSASPGAALERVLSAPTDSARDIVLLTHPRSLAEPDTIAAARRLPLHFRLFAVAVNDQGEVAFSAIRNGAPVLRSRLHVEAQRTAPPVKTITDPLTPWRGDVEPVPYPFRFGLAVDQKPIHLAFDAAGDWLIVATHGGILHATRSDGSRSEILPRGRVESTIAAAVTQLLGVAGGFVVISQWPDKVMAFHYDLATRTCTAHSFVLPTPPEPVKCFYMRSLHTLVLGGRQTQCLHLSTGSRDRPPAAFENLDSRIWTYPLPIQGEGEPITPDSHWCWPQLRFRPAEGRIRLEHVSPAWDDFTPLEDNQPVLKWCNLVSASCQRYTVAALFTNPRHPESPPMLRLFRGPHGMPLAAFPQTDSSHRFVLSNDGRWLAHLVGGRHVQIRDALDSKSSWRVLSSGRFHPQIEVYLGECWLAIVIGYTFHLARWESGTLILKTTPRQKEFIEKDLPRRILPTHAEKAVPGRLPSILPADSGHRFLAAVWNNLIAVVDRFGEVALFEVSGDLVCMFFAFRQQIAVWMPDGTCHGPMSLLGRSPTPDALEKIGAALREAWQRGERTVV